MITMRSARRLGFVLLGIWLFLTGLAQLLAIIVSSRGLLLGVLAIAAGGVLLLSGASTRPRSPGFMLLGVWLIITGLIQIVPLRLPGGAVLLGLLAVASGIVLLIGTRGRIVSLHPGITLLSLWLIISGLLQLVAFSLPGIGALLAILLIVAGFFILLER